MHSVPAVEAKPAAHRFLMLDLMRGIAAIAVLIYHDGGFLVKDLLPNAYLAVDLFFLLSGFVIAHNYDRKIAGGMTFADFMVQRLIRLYPCLLLTLLLGILVFCLRMVREFGFVDGWRILGAAGFNALFLPSPVQPYNIGSYFPFDGAAWSLFFELVANAVYWITFRQLHGRLRIGLLILLAAVAMAFGMHAAGTIDIGMRDTDIGWGVARVTLTFFIGVALRRHFYEKLRLNLGELGAPLALLALLLAFSLDRFFGQGSILVVELITIALLFPMLLLVVGGATPGPRTAVVCKLAGDASYPVYLLQTPMMGVVAAIPQLLFNMKAASFTPWIGFFHVAATILLALCIDRYFELPLRTWLKEKWRRFRGTRVRAAGVAG